MTLYESPLNRDDLVGLPVLIDFVRSQVQNRGLDASSVLIISQALYFKTKRISEKPLSWAERRKLIVSLIDWVAHENLDSANYEALQPSIHMIAPDILDSMRDFGKSKKKLMCGCVGNKTRPTNEQMEKNAEKKLLNEFSD